MTEVVVHHLERSRSHRVLWLLEELGVDYALELHRRHPETQRSGASLKAIHPLGKAPLVVLDGQVYAESGAILEALLDRFDDEAKLRPPPGTDERRRFQFYLHYAEGSLMPPLLVKLLTGVLGGRQVPWIVRPLSRAVASTLDAQFTDPEIRTHLDFLEGELRERDHFCADAFSAVDIQMSFPLEGATIRAGLTPTAYPRLTAYLDRVRDRPAYAAAIERGGPLDLGSFGG